MKLVCACLLCHLIPEKCVESDENSELYEDISDGFSTMNIADANDPVYEKTSTDPPREWIRSQSAPFSSLKVEVTENV